MMTISSQHAWKLVGIVFGTISCLELVSGGKLLCPLQQWGCEIFILIADFKGLESKKLCQVQVLALRVSLRVCSHPGMYLDRFSDRLSAVSSQVATIVDNTLPPVALPMWNGIVGVQIRSNQIALWSFRNDWWVKLQKFSVKFLFLHLHSHTVSCLRLSYHAAVVV